MSRVNLSADEEREINGLLEAILIHGIEQVAHSVVVMRATRGQDVGSREVKRVLCDHARAILARLETSGGTHLATRRVMYAEQIESLRMKLGHVPPSW